MSETSELSSQYDGGKSIWRYQRQQIRPYPALAEQSNLSPMNGCVLTVCQHLHLLESELAQVNKRWATTMRGHRNKMIHWCKQIEWLNLFRRKVKSRRIMTWQICNNVWNLFTTSNEIIRYPCNEIRSRQSIDSVLLWQLLSSTDTGTNISMTVLQMWKDAVFQRVW